MAHLVHDSAAFARNHSYPERERRSGLKLALDLWYEAWGRTWDREVAGKAGYGEAPSVAGTFAEDGTHRGGVHDLGEVAGDIGSPLRTRP